MAEADESPETLADELVSARDEFRSVLATLGVEQLNAPALIGEWGVRELVAHLAYWAGHAAEALHHAEHGRADEFGEPDLSVDERNAVVARVAREADYATASAREEAAFAALLERIRRMDPARLADRVGYGDTLTQVIRDDGADHYRGHAAELRALLEAAP